MDEKGATMVGGALTAVEAASPLPPPATRPMYLIVVSGGIPGSMLRLPDGSARLGRSNECGVQFTDPSVSRQHASIVTDAQGEVWVTDLGSTNGTHINGTSLVPHQPHRLHDGDRVQFGSSVVVKFVRLDPCDEQFQRELFERSVRDPLTGLYNRSFFLDQLAPLSEIAASRGLGLAVLMLDIDHFKQINDGLGHDAGDAVLREVATILRESTRNEDLVARYGGEEFILALPVAAPDQAAERAERVRSNLAARRISPACVLATGEVCASGEMLRVTASIGLAFAHPDRLGPPSDLITTADQCLYQAKRGGRNRVVIRVDAPAPFDSNAQIVTPRSREVSG
jgi:diguanylate cyclase (GGDEF)-like protein